MKEAHSDLAGLAQLHRLDDVAQVRSLWRRGMATLAAVASEYQPVPLEGLSPQALLAGARIALASGIFDQLDWLSPAAAAVAMYELASALPRSDEKRELGRRVLTTLHKGDAETFVALATALALGSSRSLGGPFIRARVELSLHLPVSMGTRADALALALLSRAENEREWLSVPSTGSLPSRRLAARLLERAAREAARRAAEGDDAGLQIFAKGSVASAFRRLLNDRESLVWRHVAAARGLLSEAVPAYLDIIERGLQSEFTPTEWRRSAASLAARIAIDPDETLTRASQLLFSDIVQRDPGVIASMIYGLPCAVDAEREAADELLGDLIDAGDIFAIEALVDLRRERIGSDFGVRATLRARTLLREGDDSDDDGLQALREALFDELAPHGPNGNGHGIDPKAVEAPARLAKGTDVGARASAGEAVEGKPDIRLEDFLVAALEAFAAGDPDRAEAATDQALDAANLAVIALERSSGDQSEDRVRAFRALRELDRGLLETNLLSDLLAIRSSNHDALMPLGRLRERMTNWLLSCESGPLASGKIEHQTWRLRRLRTMLHLVDADGGSGPQNGIDDPRLRERRARTMSTLFNRVSHDVPSPLRRTVCAALARACDAVVREELCELSDVFLTATTNVASDTDLAVLGEASMDPSFKGLMRCYVDILRAVDIAREEPGVSNINTCLDAVRSLVQAVPTARAPRIEALRASLTRFVRALLSVNAARSLVELAQDSASRLGKLESATQWLAQLAVGARRRLERGRHATWPRSGAALRALEPAVDRAARGEGKGLTTVVARAVQIIRSELPGALAELCALVLWRVAELPTTAQDSDESAEEAVIDEKRRMVPWLPPSRILGGFYILRSIGKGAVGSVFVARRVEERHDESAEMFALKVPEYHGAAAHLLSEAEFHELFREEARALLALPRHPNLAHFVTFDVGARPKPILVMELVRGPTLERVLDREEFTVAKALRILDGIALGLEAMHVVGVAHLDVKPSNIILRDNESGGPTPVLVDFGLAGRKIRPGCATVHYGGPEVWSTKPHLDLEPMPTDVYAFSCLAFELLTNEILFDGDTAVSIVSAHVSHDGVPDLLRELGSDRRFTALVELLRRGLCPAAKERAAIRAMRKGLAELADELSPLEWPLRPE